MNQRWVFHDSHSLMHRSPFGAVSCNEKVFLRLDVDSEQAPESVILRLWRKDSGEDLAPMVMSACDGPRKTYRAEITAPAIPCLLWYFFIIRLPGKTFYYGNNSQNSGGIGIITEEWPASYQITVYKQGFKTPDWFKEAVMYQIFPDRFYNGNEDGTVLNPKKGSLIHAHWDNTPFYIRDVDTKRIFAYDFFGGNLTGIIKKLPYLKELGITVIYLNPVFESPSNHRYDIADYKKIDGMLGGNEDFRLLCSKARELGISIILDGVFSHTGSDSIYFNKEGNYPEAGAFQSTESPYYKWYRFIEYPNIYESWWGIDTMPNVNELEPSYLDYIIEGKNSVIAYWLDLGAAGWRLDVADELPDEFIKRLRTKMKAIQPDSILIGEVWEDASRKISYDTLREFLYGEELDSVMNYPFRTIALDYIMGRISAQAAQQSLVSLYENYPKEVFYANMNLIGGHDVPRVLTLLGEAPSAEILSIEDQARFRLSPEQKQRATERLKLLVLWQMTFPGVPCIYYGDEAGVQGYRDPFNRRTFPWGSEDQQILKWYKKIIALRQQYDVLRTGEWMPLYLTADVYGYVRRIAHGKNAFGQPAENNVAIILVNRNVAEEAVLAVDVSAWCDASMADVLNGYRDVPVVNGRLKVRLQPLEGKLYLKNIKTSFERSCGVLLHITSLPSKFGIGDLGPQAYDFIDLLQQAGQKLWQILPLNPVGYGESPYQGLSAFAGNHWLISIERLVADGLLPGSVLDRNIHFDQDKVEFRKVKRYKEKLLRMAYRNFTLAEKPGAYCQFTAENSFWLDDYALFRALKSHFGETAWNCWEPAAALREPDALNKYQNLLAADIEYHKFVQFIFFQQWFALKRYANAKGVKIIGDMPLFIAHDSSDVWANRQLFQLDEQGNPSQVAGVPPDYFSETGQLWGNPHYNWTEMEKNDYYWWQQRFTVLLRLVDIIRIDHFRGFESYWQIPAGESNAVNGQWVKGPGEKFFRTMENKLGQLPIIAEDLGIITPEVEELKERLGFPGMKVLHFSFVAGEVEADYPHNFEKNAVVYTGTHDNDTTAGWYKKVSQQDPECLCCMVNCLKIGEQQLPELKDKDVCWRMIEYAYQNTANTAIVPLQDILCLGSEARMNYPGTVGGNWQWRFRKCMLTPVLIHNLAQLALKHNR